jgi:hypothetical protein
MEITRIEFAEDIRDVDNDNIDVFVENEDGYTYTVTVGTPQDLLEEMNQRKRNFVQPGTLMIIVSDDHCEKTNKRDCYGSDTSLREK